MKKWKKVCIVIAAVIVFIVGAGYGVYKVSVEPKLENSLEKAQKVLNDENVQVEIDNFVKEMIESGVLHDSDIQGYIDLKLQQTKNSDDNEAVSPVGTESSTGNIVDGANAGNAQSEKPSSSGTSGGSVANSGDSSGSWKDPNYSGQTKPPSRKKLIDRVREAMTAEEFSFAMSMYGKLDVGYITANIDSDRAAVKQYVKSTLTSSEISQCIEIYGKYSYLLKD